MTGRLPQLVNGDTRQRHRHHRSAPERHKINPQRRIVHREVRFGERHERRAAARDCRATEMRKMMLMARRAPVVVA